MYYNFIRGKKQTYTIQLRTFIHPISNKLFKYKTDSHTIVDYSNDQILFELFCIK